MATSSHAVSVEEVEDDENIAAWAKPKLSKDTERYVVMSECAYRKHAERGENGPKNPKKPRISTVKVENCTNEERNDTTWIGDPRLPHELNEMMATMWTYNNLRQNTRNLEITQDELY